MQLWEITDDVMITSWVMVCFPALAMLIDQFIMLCIMPALWRRQKPQLKEGEKSPDEYRHFYRRYLITRTALVLWPAGALGTGLYGLAVSVIVIGVREAKVAVLLSLVLIFSTCIAVLAIARVWWTLLRLGWAWNMSWYVAYRWSEPDSAFRLRGEAMALSGARIALAIVMAVIASVSYGLLYHALSNVCANYRTG